MHKILSLIVSMSLVGNSVFAGTAPRASKPPVFDKSYNQLISRIGMNEVFRVLKGVKTPADFEKKIFKKLSARDQKDMLPYMRRMKSVPKFVQLNRGLRYQMEGQTVTLTVEDISRGKYKINERFDWTYSKDNSLKIQLEALERAMNRKSASLFNLLLVNEAEAIVWFIPVIVGFIVAAILQPTATDLWFTFAKPYFEEQYCKGADPKEYRFAKACTEYFKWTAQAQPKNPTAAATENPLPPIRTTTTCRTPDSPMYIDIDVKDPRMNISVRRTINFGPDNKPLTVVEEMLNPPDTRKITYTLNPDGTLLKATDGENYMLSRDPVDQTPPDQLENLKAMDHVAVAVLAEIANCNEQASGDIRVAADLPATLIVEEMAKQDSASPSSAADTHPAAVTK